MVQRDEFISLTCRKQCVQSFNTFDFLKDTVRRVPDLGGSDAVSDDRSATKRRYGKIGFIFFYV